jgi:uncharacterized repeat protein (TIGR01451 family)
VRAKRRARRRWALSLFAVPLTLVALVFGSGAPAASAASSAQLLVSVVAVDASTGVPITNLAASTRIPGVSSKIAYRVDFSCVTADCTNATVKFDPTQLDPNHDFYRLLTESGFTPPLSGGSISGSAAAGYTVSLGNLTAGQSGQFTVEYSTNPNGCGDWNVPRDGEKTNCAVSNFPNGFPITQTVRGNADTATGERTATSAPVTWQISTPTPGVSYSNMVDPNGKTIAQGGVLATDTPYKFNVSVGSGCVTGRTTAYLVEDPNGTICASGFTVSQQLPPGAELVTADGSPTVSGDVSTGLILTWTGPEWTAAQASAAGGDTSQLGWGAVNTPSPSAAAPRSVTIEFPRENLAPEGQSCDYNVHTAGPSAHASVTYISMPGSSGEVKTAAAPAGSGYTVRCLDPFGRAVISKSSTFDGAHRINANLSPETIPAAGKENDKEWDVTVSNEANVDGVATVTDDTLDQPGAAVYQIVAPASSTIAWTATDGTTTQSGTSTGTANAPTGFRFVTSTVTSPSLTGPNFLPTDTGHTDYTVRYLYRVSPDAEPGGRRTNTATALMTYPGYPQLADIPLTASHTIEFEAPFTGGTMDKAVHDTTVNNTVTTLGIPANGSNRGFWWVDVYNTGNAPAVPVVTDQDLDQGPTMPVYEVGLRFDSSGIATPTSVPVWTGTIAYTLDDGTTGTVTGSDYTAPAGRRIVAATITGNEIPGGRAFASDTSKNRFFVLFYTSITSAAVPNSVHDNTASAQLEYPNYDLPTVDLGSDTARVTLLGPKPTITAALGAAQIAGGATRATPATDVSYTVCGTTSNVAADRKPFTPQYVFMAPAGWNITPGSASFPAGKVPAGVSYSYRTVTVDGVDRQVVVATWPAGTSFGQNATLPCMTVVTRPSSTAASGTTGVPRGFVGNSGDVQIGDIFTDPFADAPDLDADGQTAELFSEAPAPAGVQVAAVGAMQVLKEICYPDSSQADGCRWYSDPSVKVGVPPNSASIKYRISVTNTGNTTLSNVVGYDVLPYVGDTGTSDATGSTQRGSTFRESIAAATGPTDGATATFSQSTQPCRSEVDPTVANCANDWSSTSSDAQAIRLSKAGDLAPGESFSMEYTAAVNDAPGNGAIGCNSFAVRATGLANVSEPAPVCATVQETDLRIVAGAPHLQNGRPGVLPWTVTNLGGAASSSGQATVHVPAGLEVTSFSPAGWTCSGTDSDGHAVFGSAVGPVTLTCQPDQSLLLNVPQSLDIPVLTTAVKALAIPAHVAGPLFDQNLANNDDSMAVDPQAAPAAAWLSKDDGVTQAKPGDTLSYTITATNPLDFETITGATLTDTLPAGVRFVSASNGGTQTNGVVTWALPDMPGGAAVTRTVTVKVLSTISTATLVNTATVSAPDPAFTGQTLTATADDTDTVITDPSIAVVKATTTAQVTEVGQVVPYTFTVTNTGDVDLAGVQVDDQLAAPSTEENLSAVTCPTATLASGASMVCAASYTVTQADIDAGTVADTAHAAGNSPAGATVTAQSSVALAVVQRPEITIVKSSPDLTTPITAPGQTIHYQFVVTNAGNVDLLNVQVDDQVAAPSSQANLHLDACPRAALAPGESMICSGTYTATQADVDNGSASDEATASGRTVGGQTITSDPSELMVPSLAAPALSVLKASTTALVTAVGQQVPYTFTVTDTGNTTMTAISVADVVAGPSAQADLSAVQCPASPLIPGQSLVCTATYTATQADLDNGKIADEATASGIQPATNAVPNPLPTFSDPSALSIPVEARPHLSLSKTADTSLVSTIGEPVTYTITVTNTGNVSISGLQVEDTVAAPSLQSDLSTVDCGPDPITLASGESASCTVSYTATQADLDNGKLDDTATATGADPAGDTVKADPAALSVPVAQIPALTVTKTSATTQVDKVGQKIGYVFTVTNTGNVTLTSIGVADAVSAPSLQSDLSAVNCVSASLAPGDSTTCSASYTATQADLDHGTVDDTATASGVDPSGAGVASRPATLSIPVEQAPALSVAKTSEARKVTALGQKVTYTFAVVNTGNVTLNSISVKDSVAAPSLQEDLSLVICLDTVLAPGAETDCTAVYTVTQADLDHGSVDDIAIGAGMPPATAAGPKPDPVHSEPAALSIPVAQTPRLTVKKESETTRIRQAGQTVAYTFTVSNVGNVTLRDVQVTDTVDAPSVQAALSAVVCPSAPLAPRTSAVCTASYVVAQADIDHGRADDSAIASATPPSTVAHPSPTRVISEESTLSIPVQQNPDLSVVKASDTTQVTAAGQKVPYTFTVTNTGNRTLHDVQVTDTVTAPSQQKDLSTVVCPGSRLAPGDSMRCAGVYTVTQADLDHGTVDDVATVTGVDPSDETVTSAPSALSVPVAPHPALTVVKESETKKVGEIGQKVPYTFTVTNTGNVTLFGVTVDDSVASPSAQSDLSEVSCPKAELAPGESEVCAATYTVGQADLNEGRVDDTATASAKPPATQADPEPGTVTSAKSSLSIPAEQFAALTVLKEAPGTSAATVVGQHIGYTFTVTNTGNVTIAHVSVEDRVAAPSAQRNLSTIDCPRDALEPGESEVCTATYTVEAADLAHGDVTDTATASGSVLGGAVILSTPSRLALPAVDPAVALPVVSG